MVEKLSRPEVNLAYNQHYGDFSEGFADFSKHGFSKETDTAPNLMTTELTKDPAYSVTPYESVGVPLPELPKFKLGCCAPSSSVDE